LVKDNHLLGSFTLDDLQPALKCEMNFDVTFDIDANGILSVHARDTKTGKEKEIKVDTRNLQKE